MAQQLADIVKGGIQLLPDADDHSFGSFFDRFGKSRVVLIGDASHGTSDFYRARAEITKRLIKHHGFNAICIEGDWPDAHEIDRYVRQKPSPPSLPQAPIFNHFPRWMWRNTETQDFVDWLRKRNLTLPYEKRTSFHGLDLYSMGASTHAVTEYLDRVDPALAKEARKRYGCLEPWLSDPSQYGRASLSKGYAPCEAGVVKTLRDLLSKRLELISKDETRGEAFLDAEMNARLVRDAERYYRAIFYGDSESWNLRDTHFADTLFRVMRFRPGAKAVIWAHNSHVGDARATAMSDRSEINLGQLVRERFSAPGEVAIIGCGTHSGTIAAADEWDFPERVMYINPSHEDSYERVMHNTGILHFLLDLRQGHQREEILKALMEPRLERFIGVIYRAETERSSHYMKVVLPKQFDAFVWFDKTHAVTAFEKAQPREAISIGETYPFGL